MKKPKFQKGDKVYAIRNEAWGMRPMTVLKTEQTGAICQHGVNTGWFPFKELAHMTPQRTKALAKLRKLGKQLDAMSARLFGKTESLGA